VRSAKLLFNAGGPRAMLYGGERCQTHLVPVDPDASFDSGGLASPRTVIHTNPMPLILAMSRREFSRGSERQGDRQPTVSVDRLRLFSGLSHSCAKGFAQSSR
jgi:hypothetical protein